MKAMALLSLVACLMLVTGCEDSPTPNRPVPSARVEDLAKAPVDLTKRCPEPAEHISLLTSGTLPAGALVVRLCSGWQSPYADGLTPTIAAPFDALARDPDRLVRFVNSLEPMGPMPSGSYCGGVGGPAVDLWFGYPDGRAVAGRWTVGGCEGMRFEGQQGRGLENTPELFTRYADLLARQRASERPRLEVPPPTCNPTYQPVSPFGYETLPPLAAATYCVVDDRGRWRSVGVPPRLVRMINKDATPHRRVPGCDLLTGAWLRGQTVFGDRIDLMSYRCRWTLPNSLAHIMRRDAQWQPSPKLQRALDALPLGPPRRQRKPDGTLAGQ